MVSIIALGESASQFDGKGDTLGVNDAWRHFHTDILLVCDPPNRFTPERRKIITDSKPRLFISNQLPWMRHFMPEDNADRIRPSMRYNELFFSDGRKMRFSPWKGLFNTDRVHYSLTSPFVAINLAYKLGYKEIVLWGVDFKTHKSYKHGSLGLETEKRRYKELITALAGIGVSVRHGVKGSEIEI